MRSLRFVAVLGLLAVGLLAVLPAVSESCPPAYRVGYYAPPAYQPQFYPSQPMPGYYAPMPAPGYGAPMPQPAGSAYGQAQPPGQQSNTVIMYDNRFLPPALTVAKGTTVRWTNMGQHRHTATADDKKWDSGELSPGATWEHTFNDAGEFHFHCALHNEMKGTIVVK